MVVIVRASQFMGSNLIITPSWNLTYYSTYLFNIYSYINWLIPNSVIANLGFEYLWPGTGDTKLRAPKNRNSPGTLLEPFAFGLQSRANFSLQYST